LLLLILRFLIVNMVAARSVRPKNAAKIAVVGNSGVAGDASVVDVGVTVGVGEELLVVET